MHALTFQVQYLHIGLETPTHVMPSRRPKTRAGAPGSPGRLGLFAPGSRSACRRHCQRRAAPRPPRTAAIVHPVPGTHATIGWRRRYLDAESAPNLHRAPCKGQTISKHIQQVNPFTVDILALAEDLAPCCVLPQHGDAAHDDQMPVANAPVQIQTRSARHATTPQSLDDPRTAAPG